MKKLLITVMNTIGLHLDDQNSSLQYKWELALAFYTLGMLVESMPSGDCRISDNIHTNGLVLADYLSNQWKRPDIVGREAKAISDAEQALRRVLKYW